MHRKEQEGIDGGLVVTGERGFWNGLNGAIRGVPLPNCRSFFVCSSGSSSFLKLPGLNHFSWEISREMTRREHSLT